MGRGWEDCADGRPRGQPHPCRHPPPCAPRVLQETHVLTERPWSPRLRAGCGHPVPSPAAPRQGLAAGVGPAPRTTGPPGCPHPGSCSQWARGCRGGVRRASGGAGWSPRQARLTPGASPHRRAGATAEGRAELREGSAQPRRGPVLGPLPWERAQQGLVARAAGTGKEPQPRPPTLRLQGSSLGRGRPGAQTPSAVRAQPWLHSGPGAPAPLRTLRWGMWA